MPGAIYLGEELLHNFRAVVDSENNVCDTRRNEGLNLVHDHGLVAKLDEGLWEGEGLGNRIDVNTGRSHHTPRDRKLSQEGKLVVNCGTYERTEAGAKAADKNKSWKQR